MKKFSQSTPTARNFSKANAGSIKGVSQKRTRTCAYKGDTETQTRYTFTAACKGLQDFEEGFKLGALIMLKGTSKNRFEKRK